MSISEIESKVRELRQLQALIEEAQQEAEAIRDAIKSVMGSSEELRAGEYKDRYRLQAGHSGPAQGHPGRGRRLYQDHHHTPLLRGLKE